MLYCLVGLRPGQGTNKNEGLHRIVNEISGSCRYSPELSYAWLTGAFFHHNEAISAKQMQRRAKTISQYSLEGATSSPEPFGFTTRNAFPCTCVVADPEDSTGTPTKDPLNVMYIISSSEDYFEDNQLMGSHKNNEFADTDYILRAKTYVLHALAHQVTYNHVSQLSSTSGFDYHCFPFLETCSTLHIRGSEPGNSFNLDCQLKSLQMEKVAFPLPPLPLIAKIIYQQLLTNCESSEIQTFMFNCLSTASLPVNSDALLALLQSLLHDILLSYQAPFSVTYEQQIQLSHEVCHEHWCDVEFIHIVLRCLSTILRTPIVLLTGHLDFPCVPFIPSELSLSCLTPVYIAVASIYLDAFWEVHSAPSPVQADNSSDVTNVMHQPNSTNGSGASSELNPPILQIHSTVASITVPDIAVTNHTAPSTSKEYEWNESCLDKSLESSEQEMLQPVRHSGQPVATDEQVKPGTSQFLATVQQELPSEDGPSEILPPIEITLPGKTTKCTCGHSSKRDSSCCNQPGLYRSRCPCLKGEERCSELCVCKGCANPHGAKPVQHTLSKSQPITRKRNMQTAFQHATKKKKAVDYLISKAETIKTGPHSILEYFVLTAILNGECVLQADTPIEDDDIACLYSNAVSIIHSVTQQLPIYQRSKSFVLRLSKIIKDYYNFVTIQKHAKQ